MTKLKLLGAAAILSTALAAPLMAQEATQEPGMVGFNYPNSNYLRGGYGVHLPSPGYRYRHAYYGPAYGPAVYDAAPVGVGVQIGPLGVGVAAGPAYDSYAYYGPDY
jgi:hypothetical protein